MQIEATIAVLKTVHSVSTEGDLALRIQLDDRETLLLVSSTLLSRASRPFSEKLDAARVSDTDLESSTKELSLVEDDGKAIYIICDIIHGRDSEVPDKVPVDLLDNIALCCDKYELADLLAPRAHRWFTAVGSNSSREHQIRMITIIRRLRISLDLIVDDVWRSRNPSSRYDDTAGRVQWLLTFPSYNTNKSRLI